ncbi:MAG TPA: preprotein translocase subunit SecA [Candidatus Limnocylindria bacterium]|nr:preprotein translocase subunit SecA [Candidatus Limnocylindria bacterium]
MLKNIVTAIMGDRHEREARKLQPLVDTINAHSERLKSLSEEELKGQTERFRAIIRERTGPLEQELEELRKRKRVTEDIAERQAMSDEMRELEDGMRVDLEAVLEDILPEAFATVKEACRRNMGREITVSGRPMTWDMIPYDVQLVGAIALHRGTVAEMATGEGKTLVATMPLYLNALPGRGVHLVTVNSYLAQRDAEWMGTIYRYLGLTVDCIDLYEPNTPERRAGYAADITYGTNNEFGFDYLRDNMVHSLDQRVQRLHNYAIIDEVDSILIDEARTPLIISGPVAEEQSDIYRRYNPMVSDLFRRQARVASELVAAAEQQLRQADETSDEKVAAALRFEAGEKLLAAKRGTPKNRRLQKMFADEPSVQKLVQQVEAGYMREKRLHELDELLLFQMDEKGHTVSLSDQGLEVMSPSDPDAFTTPDLSVDIGRIQNDPDLSVDERRKKTQELEKEFAEKSQKIHAVHQLLKAHALYTKDEQYIVEEGQVVIVDEYTGRKMVGRRWSDGLHQAVEAKEGVTVKGETQTYATITIQNYFRMYSKLSGMTGTAETEEGEFHQIYNLDVMVIPTNRPIVRDDRNDLIYRTRREKYNAILDEIERMHMLKLPVLVGTVSVDVSETVSRMLKRRGIKHSVLNAKYHQQEAEIVAGAGQPGAVTIATNMAGRGTDIKLGPGVTAPRTVGWAEANGVDLSKLPLSADPFRSIDDPTTKPDDYLLEEGGLHIVGSERHESRRIDRQLRGRAGRQGDPGASQFLMSLEDDLMRLFGGMERIAAVMDRMGAEEGEVITHGLVTKSIERAQKRVEMQNFEARKRLLDYDDVMNQQREVVYDMRLFALEGGEDLRGEVWEMTEAGLRDVVAEFIDPDDSPEYWDLAGLRNTLVLDFMLVVDSLPSESGPDHEFDTYEQVEQTVIARANDAFRRKLDQFGDHRDRVMSWVMLGVIDEKWRDHLYDLDHLKASIGFRGWGQKDPLIEYKGEAYDLFVGLMKDLRRSIASIVFRAQLAVERRPPAPLPRTLTMSGPSDTPDVAPRAAVPAAENLGPADRLVPGGAGGAAGAAAGRAATRGQGVGSAMAAMMSGAQPGPDPRRLSTNRGEAAAKQQPVKSGESVGRNDPCPCGSGKKYKKCHGAGAGAA